ncbi:MAG: hypothetical protein ABI068_13580 [Ktedonobacterales bacterium]
MQRQAVCLALSHPPHRLGGAVWEQVDAFAEAQLSSACVQIPIRDQRYLGVYVPKAVAPKLEGILERLDSAYPPRPLRL